MEFDRAAYYEYMDDTNFSQGFYVTPGKDGSVLLGCIRRVEKNTYQRYHKAERAATFAVAEHNNKVGEERSLAFVKLTNLNVEPTAGAIYYVTAEVVEKSTGEWTRYELKIWEKLNSGYQVQIFRPAPYWVKVSDMPAPESSRVGITDLMPWMDENYLYYKCFSASRQVLGVRAFTEKEQNRAYIWVRNSAEREKFVSKYRGRKMPHSDIVFTFDV